MPTASVYRNTGLASVPEDELLQKQRSIKRSAHHRSSNSMPAVHLGESSRNGSPSSGLGGRNYKGKGKEIVDRTPAGEWVVDVNEMDSGLETYGEKERVILVIGGKHEPIREGPSKLMTDVCCITDMPSTTREVIITSGNFPNTLLISVSSDSGSSSPYASDNDTRDTRTSSDGSGRVKFIHLPSVDLGNRSDPVEEYRSAIREARKAAENWRKQQRMASPAARWIRDNRSREQDQGALNANRVSKSKSTEFRKSKSFSLLSLASGDAKHEAEETDNIDAIITYLPSFKTRETEATLQALLRRFCDVTTAISPILREQRRSEPTNLDGSPGGFDSKRTRLIYVLPESYPANLPRTLQTYLASALAATDAQNEAPRAFLLERRTMDRKMQRQEDRSPVTGLEIILSDSLHWNPRADVKSDFANIFLEDFKQCRFLLAPATESFDSNSTNASYSSLSATATTDGAPLTPRLSPDEESTLDAHFRQDKASGEYEGSSTSLSNPVSSSTSSTRSAKKAPFLRRIFSSVDRTR